MKKSNESIKGKDQEIEIGGEWRNVASVVNISSLGRCSLKVAVPDKSGLAPKVFSVIGDEIFVFESNEECVRAFLREALLIFIKSYPPTLESGLFLSNHLARLDQALNRAGVSVLCVKVVQTLMKGLVILKNAGIAAGNSNVMQKSVGVPR